jgi:uncharacterized protein YjiS (DUF1127 family)
VNPGIPAGDQETSAPQRCLSHAEQEQTMLIPSLIALIRRYVRYRSQLTRISQLDERTLRDIGISRSELVTVAWRYSGRRPYP